MIEESNYRHAYFIKKDHEGLSKLCIDELSQVKLKGVDCAKFRDTAKYALRHGVQHMLQLDDVRVCSLEEVVTKFVLDVELVYAKLCVNITAAFEDIVCVQKQAGIEELQRALNTLLVLLRKHVWTLEKLPHSIFQTLLNEGGPELSSEALHLLETKYSEIAYMEYLHKENLQGRVQSTFPCSDCFICFDVSPQLDYMVCECYNGLIQLWSLNTGKQLWKRNVGVPKYYYEYDVEDLTIPPQEPYRGTKNHCVQNEYNGDGMQRPSKSLFRSVVFHPTKDLVLPGILSHAYTFDGNLKPRFDSSKCCFWVCSISFLLGDPFYLASEGDIIPAWKLSLAFVLNEKSVLTVRCGQSVIEMLQLDELTKDTAGRSKTTARKVALSLSGDTLYVITTTKGNPATLMAWDITSSMFKPGKKVIEHTGGFNEYNLVAVREGVLLQTSHNTLELWNVELSECIRSWADLEYITEVIPISEERVACKMRSAPPIQRKVFRKRRGYKRESNVIILDTAREGSVSTIAFDGDFVGCNSKCHVISAVHGKLQMKCGDKVLWKIYQPFGYPIFPRCKACSPTEQYYVFTEGAILMDTIFILDVDSGKTLFP